MLGAIVVLERERAARPEDIEQLAELLGEFADPVLAFGDAQGACAQAGVSLLDAPSELAAVAAALRRARVGGLVPRSLGEGGSLGQGGGDDHAIVLSADLTHPSAELVRYLVHIRAGHEAVVPVRRDGSWQALCALYHSRCAGRAEGLVAAGAREAEALLAEVEVRTVTVEEVAKFGDPERLLAVR